MHWLDWGIIALLFVSMAAIAFSTKKYTRSVADFLVASRCGGRYLLTMADGAAVVGAITLIGDFEKFYQAGFAAAWWGSMLLPISLVLALSGWIVYRYRETRVMTMAQFFEVRYSRNFRIFSGILAWIAGLINYAIFPAVTGRFLIYLCDIPQYVITLGFFKLNITLGIVMFLLLSIALLITFLGGQIASMVTDFFQAQFFNIGFLLLMFILLMKFGWTDIVETLKLAPAGKSLLNPFDQAKIPDFNFAFFAMQIFVVVYGYRVWQGNQGYQVAAKSPHEAKMARILTEWRTGVRYMMIMLIPICCYVLLNSSLYTEQAVIAKEALGSISNHHIRTQLTVAVVFKQILPVGMVGVFTAIILAASISTDTTYMHSWGSLFVQDVVLPLRKKKLTQERHMKFLRFSIFGVAVFVWCFSMCFTLYDYVNMFLTISGAIFIGGAGSAIIFGLYWKRGTTAGAWASMCVGSALAVLGIVLRNIIWPFIPGWQATYKNSGWINYLPKAFPLNGMEMAFYASLLAMGTYLIVSFFTKPDPNFNMDKMLYRGKYQVGMDHTVISKPIRSLAFLGITEEFTTGDKAIYLLKIWWTIFWFSIFIIGTFYNLVIGRTSDDMWAKYWLFYVCLSAFVGVVTTVWFLWGGIHDLCHFYKALRTVKRDDLDDGSVLDPHNLSVR